MQHKIDENLYQGYSLGFSTNKLTLDGGEGNTKTNTIHADIYRKIEEKEYGVTISLELIYHLLIMLEISAKQVRY